MKTSKRAITLAAILVLSTFGTAVLLTGHSGKAAAEQGVAPCTCAPYTAVTAIATNVVHCQCGEATCVVSEHISGQSKSYGFQCVK